MPETYWLPAAVRLHHAFAGSNFLNMMLSDDIKLSRLDMSSAASTETAACLPFARVSVLPQMLSQCQHQPAMLSTLCYYLSQFHRSAKSNFTCVNAAQPASCPRCLGKTASPCRQRQLGVAALVRGSLQLQVIHAESQGGGQPHACLARQPKKGLKQRKSNQQAAHGALTAQAPGLANDSTTSHDRACMQASAPPPPHDVI